MVGMRSSSAAKLAMIACRPMPPPIAATSRLPDLRSEHAATRNPDRSQNLSGRYISGRRSEIGEFLYDQRPLAYKSDSLLRVQIPYPGSASGSDRPPAAATPRYRAGGARRPPSPARSGSHLRRMPMMVSILPGRAGETAARGVRVGKDDRLDRSVSRYVEGELRPPRAGCRDRCWRAVPGRRHARSRRPGRDGGPRRAASAERPIPH